MEIRPGRALDGSDPVGEEEQQGALSEGDVETRKMDAGGAHALRIPMPK
jgi:hypothetical protein